MVLSCRSSLALSRALGCIAKLRNYHISHMRLWSSVLHGEAVVLFLVHGIMFAVRTMWIRGVQVSMENFNETSMMPDAASC